MSSYVDEPTLDDDFGHSYFTAPGEKVGEARESAATSDGSAGQASRNAAESLASQPTYWSDRFLAILALESSPQKWTALRHLAHDFSHTARQYGAIIVSEACRDSAAKTLRPLRGAGTAGGEKYFAGGILFKFCVDQVIGVRDGGDIGASSSDSLKGSGVRRHRSSSSSGTWVAGDLRSGSGSSGVPLYMYGGADPSDERAAKAGGHELRAAINASLTSAKNTTPIAIPLMAIVDYRGYRLLAVAVLPIDASTCVYGSPDGGATVVSSDPDFAASMACVADQLGLARHSVYGVELCAPGDVEGHLGRDGRYYAIDLARLMPPEAPSMSTDTVDARRSVFYNMLRPELVRFSSLLFGPLCPDAFTPWLSKDPQRRQHEARVRQVTTLLRTKLIPNFARDLPSLLRVRYLMREAEEDGAFLPRGGSPTVHLGSSRAFRCSVSCASSTNNNEASQGCSLPLFDYASSGDVDTDGSDIFGSNNSSGSRLSALLPGPQVGRPDELASWMQLGGRWLGSVLQRLVNQLHNRGINVRRLGAVYVELVQRERDLSAAASSASSTTSSPSSHRRGPSADAADDAEDGSGTDETPASLILLRRIVLTEMIARGLKNQLRRHLRETMLDLPHPGDEPYRQALIDYVNMLLGAGPTSAAYWTQSFLSYREWSKAEAERAASAAAGRTRDVDARRVARAFASPLNLSSASIAPPPRTPTPDLVVTDESRSVHEFGPSVRTLVLTKFSAHADSPACSQHTLPDHLADIADLRDACFPGAVVTRLLHLLNVSIVPQLRETLISSELQEWYLHGGFRRSTPTANTPDGVHSPFAESAVGSFPLFVSSSDVLDAGLRVKHMGIMHIADAQLSLLDAKSRIRFGTPIEAAAPGTVSLDDLSAARILPVLLGAPTSMRGARLASIRRALEASRVAFSEGLGSIPDSFEILAGLGETTFILGMTYEPSTKQRVQNVRLALSYFEESLRAKDFGDRHGASVLPQLAGAALEMSAAPTRSPATRKQLLMQAAIFVDDALHLSAECMNDWIEGILHFLVIDPAHGDIRRPPPIFASLIDAASLSFRLAAQIRSTVAKSATLQRLAPLDILIGDAVARHEDEEHAFCTQLFDAFPRWREDHPTPKGARGVPQVFFGKSIVRGVKRKTM